MPLCQRKGRGHRVPSLLLTTRERNFGTLVNFLHLDSAARSDREADRVRRIVTNNMCAFVFLAVLVLIIVALFARQRCFFVRRVASKKRGAGLEGEYPSIR